MSSPARLAVDVQALQVDGFADRGIGRYVAAHSAALARRNRVAVALLAPELPPPMGLPHELATAGLTDFESVRALRAVLDAGRPVVHHVTAPFLHCAPTDPSNLVVVPHWADTGVARMVTLYDLIPLHAPRHYLPTAAHVERYEARAQWVAGADVIVAISEHTRQDAITLLGCDPGKVVTIGAGVSPYFTPRDGTDNELFSFYLGAVETRPFILTVGGSDVRKGTERLIAALGRLVRQGNDLHLVVVGDLTATWRTRLEEAASAAAVSERVHCTGVIVDELLRACYRRAAVTVMPSLAEGFGLPVLESAACGTPALASSSTALAEAAGTPAATFDPTDTDAMADAIGRVLSDDEHRSAILDIQRRLAADSTWDAVAQRTIDAVDRLDLDGGGAAGGRITAPRRRVAMVGPSPALGAGIALFNERLVNVAARHLDAPLDLVAPGGRPAGLAAGVRHVPVDAFGPDTRPASYDAVVYALGNSHGHLATVELALRYPGWLWLHEVRLPGIAVTALEDAGDDSFGEALGWLLERAYPGRAPRLAAQRAGRSVVDLVAAGVGLVPLLAERCQGILVNSEVARRLLLLDLAPLAHHPPVVVLPPPCPPLWAETRPPASAVTDDDVVVAFGTVSMAKSPDLLVDAAARAGCRLAFVGPCPAFLTRYIADRARARGISERVEVVGTVEDDEWKQWLRQATMAVQLRDLASGETSGAVLEALSAGVPVVTNLASAAELPPGTVALLPSTEPEVVGSRLRALLDDPDERQALSRAGAEFAAAHQFSDLARALVSAVTV